MIYLLPVFIYPSHIYFWIHSLGFLDSWITCTFGIHTLNFLLLWIIQQFNFDWITTWLKIFKKSSVSYGARSPYNFITLNLLLKSKLTKLLMTFPRNMRKKQGAVFLKSKQKLTLVLTVLPKATRNGVLNQMYGPKY